MPDRSISEGKFFWKDERDKMFIFFLLRWKCLRTQKSIYKTNTMSCIVFFLTFLQGCHLKLRYIFFYMCMWFFFVVWFLFFCVFFFFQLNQIYSVTIIHVALLPLAIQLLEQLQSSTNLFFSPFPSLATLEKSVCASRLFCMV